MESWMPIEGVGRRAKNNNVTSIFASKRPDHRNTILKDWAIRLEENIEPRVPPDYISPFNEKQCIFCTTILRKEGVDEFVPITQYGRMNKINKNPCCGKCNSSKSDKCGKKLINWIKNKGYEDNPIPEDRIDKLIEWYYTYEIYMIIPAKTFDKINNETYENLLEHKLDEMLDEFYMKMT